MKKKFLALVIIIVVLATALSGCTFIQLNSDRQAQRVLRTVTKGDVSLDITYTELSDYTSSLLYGSFYSYVSYGYMTIEDVANYALAAKTQSKTLTIYALDYLGSKNRSNLVSSSLYDELTSKLGSGHLNKKVLSVLTVAEYYDALISVNSSVESLYDNYVEEYYNNLRKDEVYSADLQDVEEIKLVRGLQGEYYVGSAGPDTADLLIEVVYKDSSKPSIQLPVSNNMISKAFSSSEAAEDSEFTIKLDVENKNEDGNYVAEVVTVTEKYNVIAAPTLRDNDEEEKVALDEIRNMSADEIASWVELNGVEYDYEIPSVLDLDALRKSDDAAVAYAWGEVADYLEESGRSIDYYYASAIETEVISAYKAVINAASEEEIEQELEAKVAQKILSLKNDGIKNYNDKTAAEKKSAFISAIGDALDSLYYVPEVDSLRGYFYVSHLLIKDESIGKEFVIQGSDDKLIAENIGTMTVDEVNPRFDVSFECDGWHYNEEGEYIHDAALCSDNGACSDKSDCKSIAYIRKDVKATEMLDNLADALAAETDGANRVNIFNEYVEKYGQDGGILSQTNGYLITPDTDDMSWVDGFESLGILLGASAGYSNVGTYQVDRDSAIAAFKDLYSIEDAEAEELYNKYNEYVNVYTSGNGNKLYFAIGNTVTASGSSSEYAGIHVMMVTFFPFSGAEWSGESVIDINGTILKQSVYDSTLDTMISDEYTEITDWLSDYEQDDNGYSVTLGSKYTDKGFSVKDHKKLGDYIDNIVSSYGG